MPRPRTFSWDEAKRLRSQGLTYREIANHLGVSDSAVVFACDDRQRAMAENYKAEWQRRNTCVDCGKRTSRNRLGHVSRCLSCSAKARATTVRETTLRCSSCGEWKPDNAFPYSRAARQTHRGRHQQCRACQTIARRAYRNRHKVPCVGCGKPALPPSEKGTHGTSQPRCRDCMYDWMRLPEQREAARKRALARRRNGHA